MDGYVDQWMNTDSGEKFVQLLEYYRSKWRTLPTTERLEQNETKKNRASRVV